VVPIDGSKASENALEYAIKLQQNLLPNADKEIIILNDWLHQHEDNKKLFERLFHPDNLSGAIMALNN